MDTKSLTLLVEILDAGNLSEAARRLKMTRANVSYHLSQLERSVGMAGAAQYAPRGSHGDRAEALPARPQHPG